MVFCFCFVFLSLIWRIIYMKVLCIWKYLWLDLFQTALYILAPVLHVCVCEREYYFPVYRFISLMIILKSSISSWRYQICICKYLLVTVCCTLRKSCLLPSHKDIFSYKPMCLALLFDNSVWYRLKFILSI